MVVGYLERLEPMRLRVIFPYQSYFRIRENFDRRLFREDWPEVALVKQPRGSLFQMSSILWETWDMDDNMNELLDMRDEIREMRGAED